MKKNILTAISICILFCSCKSINDISESHARKLPSGFLQTSGDSTNSANIKWKDFFGDHELIALIDSALISNQDVMIAYQRVNMATAEMRLRKGALLPTASIHAEAAQRRFGLYTMDGAGNISTFIRGDEIVPEHLQDFLVGFRASWEVDIFGKLRNRKTASLARYLSTFEGKNWLITNLISEIAGTYYELIALDHALEIIRDNIELQENALRLVSIQKESGVSNQLAVRQMEGRLFNMKALEVETEQNIRLTENRLNVLQGKFPAPVRRNKDLYSAHTPQTMQVGIPADLLINRPDIRQAEQELLASRLDVKAARAAFLPSFNITGAYGYQAYKKSLLFLTPESIVYSLIGGLATPLINRSSIRSEFDYAKAAQKESFYAYQRTIIEAYTEVYDQLTNIQSLSEVYDLKNHQVNILSESVETSGELFKTGRANYLEVIASQENALNANLDLVNIKKQQFIASLNLYRALGGGWQ